MYRLLCIAIAVVVSGCAGCEEQHWFPRCELCDAYRVDATPICNPLQQLGCAVGEKCTWLVDEVMPQYFGHIGCAPAGAADVGESCIYGSPGTTGYDNCKAGLVCGNYSGGSGVCKQICDPQGGVPSCDAQHACVAYEALFFAGDTTSRPAGVCEIACDPLTDNDFDGSGALTRSTSSCGSDPQVGCYGSLAGGGTLMTAWLCMPDIHYAIGQPTGLRHRVECTVANGCAESSTVTAVNSCNQGYLPFLSESSMVSTTICVAICAPLNCYAGNCGPNDANRLGAMPNRCNSTDRVGTFDTSTTGEECTYLWYFEWGGSTIPHSPTSDTVGFCVDHSKYRYDSNGDGSADTTVPPCATLPDGFGPLGAPGAADFGCVDTTHATLPMQGKVPARVFDAVRPLFRRALAH